MLLLFLFISLLKIDSLALLLSPLLKILLLLFFVLKLNPELLVKISPNRVFLFSWIKSKLKLSLISIISNFLFLLSLIMLNILSFFKISSFFHINILQLFYFLSSLLNY